VSQKKLSVVSLSAGIKVIHESNLEDEVLLCLPPKGSTPYSFEKGVKDKVEWLRWKLRDYGYVGHIAYDGEGKPIGFIEFVSSLNSPLPVEASEKTALITCIYLPKATHGQGIGTMLLKATLRQLWKIGVNQVKTLVSRSPQWINDGIYRKHGFQLEKTFHRLGSREPLDLLTFRLDAPQPKIEPVAQNFTSESKSTLPVEVLYFHSAQCPYSSATCLNHMNAVARFSKDQVTFKVIDSWKESETARQYGTMYSDTFINGRVPFFAPPKQEDIENEIQKEINRVLELRK